MTKDFQKDEETYKKNTAKFKLFNYKIFILIICLAILYQAYLLTYEETPNLDVPEYFYLIWAMFCGIMSVVVGIKFNFHETFRTSYIALGISFFLLAFGEIIYILYSHILKIDPFPSMADVFFLASSLFAFIHLIMNINYFKNKISKKTKIILPIMGASILIAHATFSLNQIGEANLDFFVGLLYATNYSILLPLAILGIIVSWKTEFAATWLLLVIGIFFSAIAFQWWIFLEFFEEFTYRHPVNTLWIFGFMVIIFALVEHLRVLSKKK